MVSAYLFLNKRILNNQSCSVSNTKCVFAPFIYIYIYDLDIRMFPFIERRLTFADTCHGAMGDIPTHLFHFRLSIHRILKVTISELCENHIDCSGSILISLSLSRSRFLSFFPFSSVLIIVVCISMAGHFECR